MDERVKVSVFDGSDFHNWKFRMETVLDMFDLLDCLHREIGEIDELREMAADTAEVKKEKKRQMVERKAAEKKCKAMIITAIANNQLELVKDCATPKRIWDTLKTVFERRGVAGQLFIRKQLLMLKYVEGASGGLPEHLLKFDRLIRELKESGAAVEESDAICHLLLTLPSSFDSVVTAIETLPGGVTMEFVKKRLLDVDLKKKNLLAPVDDIEGVAMTSRYTGRKLKCFRCGKIGHKRADCRVRLDADPSECDVKYQNRKTNRVVEEDRSSDRADVAFVALQEELVKMKWFLDSGATDHMLNDSSFFSDMRRLDRPVDVVVANGEKLTAEYCGDVTLYAVVGNRKKKCEAKNVLYLPGLSCNLFSVQRVARSGLQVSFVGDRAEILKNGVVMAMGHTRGKLYELDVYCERREEGAAMLTQKVTNDAVVWHQRFGYQGSDNFRKMASHEMVKLDEGKTLKMKKPKKKQTVEHNGPDIVWCKLGKRERVCEQAGTRPPEEEKKKKCFEDPEGGSPWKADDDLQELAAAMTRRRHGRQYPAWLGCSE